MEAEIDKLIEDIQSGIRFLAPYFGFLSDDAIEKAKEQKLDIKLSNIPNNSHYILFRDFPQIVISKNEKNDFTIGHELGHWFHDQNNLKDYLEFRHYKLGQILMEGVANYSGIIFHYKSNPVPRLFSSSYSSDLYELSKINSHELIKCGNNIKYFFKKHLIELIPEQETKTRFLDKLR